MKKMTLATKALAALAVCLLWVSPAAADHVILDDCIIDGSMCVGFDCVNGESFGFDTIRLKENNLRLKFLDTSSTASFPDNDWNLVANDSANGGADKFSIEDTSGSRTPFTLTAGAASNSLFVSSGGRIGNKTSIPVAEIHIKDGDTPTLRLEQDGTSGFAPQIFDVAANETNFFIRDASNGSTLPFRIRPGAPTSSIDVGSDGDVGFGTASPAARLHVQVNDGAPGEVVVATYRTDNVAEIPTFQLSNGTIGRRVLGLGGGDISVDADGSGDIGIGGCKNPDHDFEIGGGEDCDGAGGAGSEIDAGETQFTVTSSRALKENLEPVAGDDILEKISDIGVYTYDFIQGGKDKLGLMAEDFHQVFGRGSDKRLNGQEVQMALWLAVQQLTEKVSDLEAELAAAKEAID